MFTLLKLFFIFILVAFLVFLFIVLAFVGNVIGLFRKVKNPQQGNSTYSTTSDSYTQNDSASDYQRTSSAQPKKKIIPQDEGEYVDFEEVDPS